MFIATLGKILYQQVKVEDMQKEQRVIPVPVEDCWIRWTIWRPGPQDSLLKYSCGKKTVHIFLLQNFT